jgi:hypothetical protein
MARSGFPPLGEKEENKQQRVRWLEKEGSGNKIKKGR